MCKHSEIRLEIAITQCITAAVTDIGAGGVLASEVTQITVRTRCDDCGLTGAHGAFAEGHKDHGPTWPKWLRRRMTWLSHDNDLVRRALDACHVPSEE